MRQKAGHMHQPPPPAISDATKQLLLETSQGQGLSQRARRDLQAKLSRGDPSWVGILSSGHSSKRTPRSQAAPTVRVPRVGAAAAPLHLLAAEPAPPGKRQAQQIQLQARPYEREQYPGSAPAADRDKEKERLAALFESSRSSSGRQRVIPASSSGPAGGGTACVVRPAAPARRPGRLSHEEQVIEQLVAEVEERRAFLMDMRRLGQGSQHAAAITAEISQRLRQLEALGVA